MEQFLYDLVNWQYFGIFAIAWGLINIAWISSWKVLFTRLQLLLMKPIILIKDHEPNNIPFYPRTLFEQLAGVKENPGNQKGTVNKPDQGRFSRYGERLLENTFDPDHTQRTIGFIIFFFSLVLLIWADFIAIANTLNLIGLWQNLPPLLQPFHIAVFAGATVATILGLALLIEIRSDTSELTRWSERADAVKKIGTRFAQAIILFSIIVLISLALERMVFLGFLESSPTLQIIINTGLYALAPLNLTIAAALTFLDAIPGVYAILYLVSRLLVAILPVLMVIVDILWRIGYFIISPILWFLFSPPFAIWHFLQWLVTRF